MSSINSLRRKIYSKPENKEFHTQVTITGYGKTENKEVYTWMHTARKHKT
jgi:hypothetical protein